MFPGGCWRRVSGHELHFEWKDGTVFPLEVSFRLMETELDGLTSPLFEAFPDAEK